MRQGEEHDVVTGEHLGGGGLEDPLGQRRQVGLQDTQRLPRVGATGEGADLDPGMPEEQAQQLAAGVPTGSGDRDSRPAHLHDYTYDRIVMHIGSRPVTMSVSRTTVAP